MKYLSVFIVIAVLSCNNDQVVLGQPEQIKDTVALEDSGDNQLSEKELYELTKSVADKYLNEVEHIRVLINRAEHDDTLQKPKVLRAFNNSEMAQFMGKQTSFGAMKKRVMELGSSYVQYHRKREMARIALERSVEVKAKH